MKLRRREFLRDVLNVGCESLAEVDDLAARVRRVEQPAA
jgi:hypothetical protein